MAEVLSKGVEDGDEVDLQVGASVSVLTASDPASDEVASPRTLSSQPTTRTAALNPRSLCHTPIAAAVRAASSIAVPDCEPPIMAFCASELAIRLPSCGT